jgi:hypothetical protein
MKNGTLQWLVLVDSNVTLTGGLFLDTEIDMTYEGDNHVLLQQVAKALMNDFTSGKLIETPSVAKSDVRNFEARGSST